MNPAFARAKYSRLVFPMFAHARGANFLKLLSLSSEEVQGILVEGKLTVGVVGLGRIGLPCAAFFANAGLQVLGADIDASVVGDVNSGRSRFVDEPGLGEMLAKVVRKGKLSASTSTE